MKKGVYLKCKGSFEYDKKIYILTDKKTKSTKYKYVTLGEFFKRIGNYDFDFLLIIRDCKILHDPLKLISVIQRGLKSGNLIGSSERILVKLVGILIGLNKIEILKLKVISNIYNSLVDYSHALFIYKGIPLPSPKNITKRLKENFDIKGMDIKIIDKIDYIINFYRSIERGERKNILGSELDSLYSDLKLIKSGMGALMDD